MGVVILPACGVKTSGYRARGVCALHVQIRDSGSCGLAVQQRISQRMALYEQLSPAVLLILLQSLCVRGNDCEGEFITDYIFGSYAGCSYQIYVHTLAVKVSLPWEERIFVPQGSSVLISCTADTSHSSESDIESNLGWSIRLPDREIDDDFENAQKKKILNDRGFYELPPTAEAIRLVVNNTDGINGTVLKCAEILSGQLLQKTTLLVYG